MATELVPNEGKQYAMLNAMSGRSVYIGLIKTKTVGAGTLTAATTNATVSELTGPGSGGTAYARQNVTLGAASSTGTISVPSTTWNPGNATDWASDCTGFAMWSAVSGGTVLFMWDNAATRDMSKANANLVIPVNTYIFKNVGE